MHSSGVLLLSTAPEAVYSFIFLRASAKINPVSRWGTFSSVFFIGLHDGIDFHLFALVTSPKLLWADGVRSHTLVT